MDTTSNVSPPTIDTAVARLVAYIDTLKDFEIKARKPYDHMGATITDVALQARWNYKRQVRPSARHVRDTYPEAATTSGFLRVIKLQGGVHQLLSTHSEKAQIAVKLAELLARREIETEAQLRDWIVQPGSREHLMKIRGVGPKTADYLAIRAGVEDAVAVDVHLRRFLRATGVEAEGYDEAAALIAAAAREKDVEPAELEGAIWRQQRSMSRGH